MGALEWLLGLDNIRLDRDAPLLLKWNHDFEPWMLFAAALATIAVVGLTYRRERLSMRRFLTLSLVRCGLLFLVGAVLCEPSLVLQRNRTEPSYVSLLLDRSHSMSLKDSYSDVTTAKRIVEAASLGDASEIQRYSRLQLIERSLSRDGGAALQELTRRNGIQLGAFSGHTEFLGMFSTPEEIHTLLNVVRTLPADGPTTDLGAAIEDVMENTRGRRLAAVVIATDGQTNDPSRLKEALDLARGKQIPIHPIPIGSTDPRTDVELSSVRTEPAVFVNDWLPIELRLSAGGLTGTIEVSITVSDETTGEIAAARTVRMDAMTDSLELELRVKPTRTGQVRYHVAAHPIAGEQNVENNIESTDVLVLSDRLRVLYVEGYPRFEYRYLKNALLREKGVEISVLLLEADERFVQEGTDPIRRFPETKEEISRFDVILFGDVDVRGGWMTAGQMKLLSDHVRDEGCGFGHIAGERSAPHSFLGTALEKLVPVRIDPDFLGTYDAPLSTGFRPRLTHEGRSSRLVTSVNPSEWTTARKGSTVGANDEASAPSSENWFESMPELYWLCRSLGPKPGAAVLAGHPTLRLSAPAVGEIDWMPMLVTGRYGSGRLFFQATDDTWRWRSFRVGGAPAGEFLHDGYWVQVVRMLAQPLRSLPRREIVVRTDRRVYSYGQPVHVQVEVNNHGLLAGYGEQLDVVVLDALSPQSGNSADRRTSTPNHGVSEPETPHDRALAHPQWGAIVSRFSVRRISAETGLFEGTFTPIRSGRFRLQPAETRSDWDHAASADIQVESPRLECPRLEADVTVLEQMASLTGGKVMELDRLDAGFEAIRDRSVRTPDDIVESLWDSRVVFLLFVLMISIEWVLRKGFGLT